MYFVQTMVNNYCTVAYHMLYPVSHHRTHMITRVHPFVSYKSQQFLVARPHLDEQVMTRQTRNAVDDRNSLFTNITVQILRKPKTKTTIMRLHTSSHQLRSTCGKNTQTFAHAHTHKHLYPKCRIAPDILFLSFANRHSICAILLARCNIQSPLSLRLPEQPLDPTIYSFVRHRLQEKRS